MDFDLKKRAMYSMEQLLKLGVPMDKILNKEKVYKEVEVVNIATSDDIVEFMNRDIIKGESIYVDCQYKIQDIIDSEYEGEECVSDMFDLESFDIYLESNVFTILDKRNTDFCTVVFKIELSDVFDLIESCIDESKIIIVDNLTN